MTSSAVLVLFLLLGVCTCQLLSPSLSPGPHGPMDLEGERSIEQLVHSRGFALEVHNVVTEDGYMLALHRIVPKHYSATEYALTRKPVVVQHGLFGASTDFLINSPHLTAPNSTCGDNFAFALLLTGRYDVWLPNSRGNEYSQQHLHYKKNEHTHEMEQMEYWKFSLDQIAAFDLPVIVDKVRSVTGREKIAYIGYSQGATAMFALLTTDPSFASKLSVFIAWAPVVYMSHIESPFRYLAPMTAFLRTLGNRFAPSSHLLSSLSHPLCKLLSLESLCTNALFLFGGFDTEHLNRTRLPLYFHFTPATASTWQVVHFLQLISSERFAKFDHGSSAENIAAYGHSLPPTYPLDRIPASLPIVIVRSQNDYLSSVPDTNRLIEELQSRSAEAATNVIDYLIPDPIWAHLDFTLGTDAGRIVYEPTISYLDQL